jgi:Cdc6-like AAA superfamily ATPase
MTELKSKQISFWHKDTLSRPVAILISGKAGTGKSTSARVLCELLYSKYHKQATVDNFARPVKLIAKKFFAWNGNKDSLGRDLLQKVGNYGRDIDPGVWARTVADDNAVTEILVVDDWRFPNEAEVLKNNFFDVVTIRINAENREILKDTEYYKDKSEVELDDYKFDYIIDNTGSMDDLSNSMEVVVRELFGQMKGQ